MYFNYCLSGQPVEQQPKPKKGKPSFDSTSALAVALCCDCGIGACLAAVVFVILPQYYMILHDFLFYLDLDIF